MSARSKFTFFFQGRGFVLSECIEHCIFQNSAASNNERTWRSPQDRDYARAHAPTAANQQEHESPSQEKMQITQKNACLQENTSRQLREKARWSRPHTYPVRVHNNANSESRHVGIDMNPEHLPETSVKQCDTNPSTHPFVAPVVAIGIAYTNSGQRRSTCRSTSNHQFILQLTQFIRRWCIMARSTTHRNMYHYTMVATPDLYQEVCSSCVDGQGTRA